MASGNRQASTVVSGRKRLHPDTSEAKSTDTVSPGRGSDVYEHMNQEIDPRGGGQN